MAKDAGLWHAGFPIVNRTLLVCSSLRSEEWYGASLRPEFESLWGYFFCFLDYCWIVQILRSQLAFIKGRQNFDEILKKSFFNKVK